MPSIQSILSDSRISPTDKLVLLALLQSNRGEVRLTNKEIASMISSAETVVSRSIKSLIQAEYISTMLENNSKRVISTLNNMLSPLNNMLRVDREIEKKEAAPLTICQAPLAKTQGCLTVPLNNMLNPLIKLLNPLSKNASPLNNMITPLNNMLRLLKPTYFDNQHFIQSCPYDFEKKNSKQRLYIYYINTIVNIKYKIVLNKKGCGEKIEKPFDVEVDKHGLSSCKVLHAQCVKFHNENPDKYKPEMYTKFIHYWSQPDARGKPKWYKEKTRPKGVWNLPLRLSTWHNNDLNYSKENGKSNKRGSSALRPTSIAEPSKRVGSGNVAHVEF